VDDVLADVITNEVKTMRRKTYTLIDGAKRHAKCPDTFEIPDVDERIRCKLGDVVKIGVEFKHDPPVSGERFWVRIVRILPSRLSSPPVLEYMGEVDNDLMFTDAHGLRLGDLVTFGPEHVLEVWDWD